MAQETAQCNIRNLDVDKKILSSIDNGILILDRDLNICYFNRWLEIHTGLQEHKLLGKKLDNFFQEINTKTLKRKINTALRLQTPTFYSANVSKFLIPIKIDQIKISNYSYMQQDVSIISFDKEKNLVALIITDQTDMANTNALLKENILKVEKLNSELIKERETINEKILLIKFNLKYVITDLSKAYLQLLGYKKEELLGNIFFDSQRFTIDKELQSEIYTYVNQQKTFKFENSVLSASGEELIFANTLVGEYDTFGIHTGFILFMQNITDTKRVIAQQEKLLTTSRSAAMGEMISMIAHQWRQPLSIINTVMATVRVKQELDILDGETIETTFEKIEDTVEYLSQTIDDFRNYFKSNKTLTDVDLSKLMNKSITFLINDMKLYNIKFIQKNETSINILTYQNELIQCIINILKNSIDAFKEQNITEKEQYISFDIEHKSSFVSLLFTDNAGGIDEKIIKRIFEPYFSTKSKNGTGLGLYMVKTIIEDHLNGKITIKSANQKTEVLIELPLHLQNTKEENASNMPPLSKR